jgi:hypothetical protein
MPYEIAYAIGLPYPRLPPLDRPCVGSACDVPLLLTEDIGRIALARCEAEIVPVTPEQVPPRPPRVHLVAGQTSLQLVTNPHRDLRSECGSGQGAHMTGRREMDSGRTLSMKITPPRRGRRTRFSTPVPKPWRRGT